MVNFKKFKTFIFDLDGTLWNMEKIFPGVIETIEKLRKEGKQVLFVTNNTFFSRKTLIRKFKGFGLEIKENELISSSQVVAEYIKLKNGNAFAIGKGLEEDLMDAGVKIEKSNPDFLAVGYDEDFNLGKLRKAYEILEKGARLLASANGRIFLKGNEIYPGTGAIVKAIEHMSNRRALVLGKPSVYMLSFLNMFVCSPMKETVLIGDELESDILLGKKAGYYTVLVRTGIDKEVKGKIRPHAVIESVTDIKL